MTPREQLQTVLDGGVPDRLPFFPVLRFWWAQQEERGTLPERWKGEEGLARLHAEIPCGLHWPPENHWRTAYDRCREHRPMAPSDKRGGKRNERQGQRGHP